MSQPDASEPTVDDLPEGVRTPGSGVPADFQEREVDTEKEGPDTDSGQSEH